MRPPWHGEPTVWRRIRRYAVPRRMIEDATERRLAGDWRGACAAANVDVDFDPDRLADEHGVADAERLAEDLRHLVPDLLRWHLPRAGCGRTTILNNRWIVLGRYGGDDSSLVGALCVVTPLYVNGSQRLRLTLNSEDKWYDPPIDWTRDRHLFDDRFCGELLRHAGGGDRAPFLHPDGTPLADGELPSSDPGPGAAAVARAEWSMLLFERGEVEAAFDAAGLDTDLGPPGEFGHMWGVEPRDSIARMPMSPSLIAEAVGRAAERGGGPPVFELGLHRSLIVEPGGGRGRPLVRTGHAYWRKGVHFFHENHWRRSMDVELVRHGLVSPDELHPLVRSALFPARPDADGPVGPPGPVLPEPVRVRCGGEWHEVRSRGGELEIPHSEEERRREDALLAFGGSVSGCFAARRTWRTGEGRLPRALVEQRRELFMRVQHADTDGVLALLDAGVDPCVRDGGRRRTLLHQLYVMDHEVMLPILLKAGLGLEDLDHHGRTALHVAVGDMGAAALVRALRDAGARTDVADDNGMDLDDLIEWRDREDLDFLDD
ncbi:ankyrin repeat domain-containing protein [Actinomadura algeriensis]|uniref:Ankyrin repeat domain-containing protein n=1 Tax=Actinomadura algeriensis TaxID=1679523 RepID=A0ABR9K3P4_9ACTN|nr:ankyrin repeat domain-containing protein [Actinomadura algeriensis]MBE1537224.1 hypothetical protein [Actinomadura algeriensis]